jgi:hypothetical protein
MTKQEIDEWIAMQSTNLMADMLSFGGSELEFRDYMYDRFKFTLELTASMLSSGPSVRVSKFAVEKIFETAIVEFNQKNGGLTPREAAIYEAAFFDAARRLNKNRE